MASESDKVVLSLMQNWTAESYKYSPNLQVVQYWPGSLYRNWCLCYVYIWESRLALPCHLEIGIFNGQAEYEENIGFLFVF